MNGNDSKQIMAKNIKYYMERKGVTNQQICDDLGFKYTTFIDWIKAVTYPRIGKVEAMADYFGILKSDLIEDKDKNQSAASILTFPGIEPMPEMKQVPRLGKIACGTPILAVEDADEFDSVPSYVICDFSLECKGDSMINARIFDGDIVFIRQQPIVDNGEIAAVFIDGETTLKRFWKYEDHIVLQPENPQYKPLVFWENDMQNVSVLGKAVSFLSNVI